MQKEDGRRIPAPSHFALRAGETGLSVNWHQRVDTATHYSLIGLQHNQNGTFLDPHSFRLFVLPIDMLRQLDGIAEVRHDPICHGDPAPVGHPNNPGHAEVIYVDQENNLDTRLILSEYCRKYPETYKPFPGPDLDRQIQTLRVRNNDTPFHCVNHWGELLDQDDIE